MRFFAVLLLTIFGCIRLIASPKDFYQSEIQHLTQEDGLANNTLYNIYQDKNGFIWLGTDVGISR